jgi:photosystem II stability/assembly factor-like uncharacterized protein
VLTASNLLLLAVLVCRSLADEAPVWTFDFRDLFCDVVMLDEQNAVIVGGRGRVLTTHDRYKSLWCPRDSGTKNLLTCLSFVDNRNGWAAGHAGVIVHTRDGGRSWEVQRQPSPDNDPLFDIQFVSPDVGYACGAYGTLLKSSDGGKTWSSLATEVDHNYNELVFLDERTGYLAGEFGTLLRTRDGGDTWERLDLNGFEGSFFGMLLLTPQKLLLFGISGKILRSDDGGFSWEDVSLPSCTQSLSAGAARGNEVVLVGRSGTLLISTDGGRTFTPRNDQDLTTFAGVCAHPKGGFLCVGERGKILPVQVPLASPERDSP